MLSVFSLNAPTQTLNSCCYNARRSQQQGEQVSVAEERGFPGCTPAALPGLGAAPA